MGINNPAGSIHDHLSQKRMAVQYAELKETAKKPHKSRGEAFGAAFQRDVMGGMRGARKVGTPLTVGTDALLGTFRSKDIKEEDNKSNSQKFANIRKYPCSSGAVGAVGGLAAGAGAGATVVGGMIVGGAAGYVAHILTLGTQKHLISRGAAVGVLATKPLLAAELYTAIVVRQGAGILGAAPKLMLNGVGAAGGAVVGLVRGTGAALSHKKP